jgi:hypothetical protein
MLHLIECWRGAEICHPRRVGMRGSKGRTALSCRFGTSASVSSRDLAHHTPALGSLTYMRGNKRVRQRGRGLKCYV